MQYFQDVLTLTATATGDRFDAYDLVSFNDEKVTTDDAPVKGIAKHSADFARDELDIGVIVIGTARVKASGPILKGDRLISAQGGGVKTAPANAVNVFARALTEAAAGEFVTILIR